MDRRNLILSILAGIASLFGLPRRKVEEEETVQEKIEEQGEKTETYDELRQVFRWNGNRWEEIAWEDQKAFDELLMVDVVDGKAVSVFHGQAISGLSEDGVSFMNVRDGERAEGWCSSLYAFPRGSA